MDHLKPKKRSALRLMLGRAYYRWKRHLYWHWNGKAYARTTKTGNLQYLHAQHQTPLDRQLVGVKQRLNENKKQNLAIASKALDGILLEPGQIFSYWRLIGKPTARKGYLPGLVLDQGGLGEGIGGGLCQLSNLVYWMTLHTDLEVVERYRHSYDVFPDRNRSQPFGSGATCVYNYRDLAIANGTQTTYQLRVWIEEGYLRGQWRAMTPPTRRYRVIEKDHEMVSTYWGGFVRRNALHRRVFDELTGSIDEHLITRNEALMCYDPRLPGDKEANDET